jgi:hypothetical protein
MGKVQVMQERKVITYADFWRTSEVLLERAQAEPRGSYYLILGSLTFSAFALEAFLNHLGESVFESWSELESINPRAKVNVICEHIGVKPNWGAQPWQIVPEIVGFRNKIAHGKNAMLKFESVVPQDQYEEVRRQFLSADWQKYATEKNAVRVRAALEELFELLHKAAAIENDYLFDHGAQIGSGRAVRE